jgi:L-rhamnose mutarotase
MKHYGLALDLKNDEQLICEYEEYHQAVWPEVAAAIKHVGVLDMKIYRLGQRLFMHMTTEDDYDPKKAQDFLQNHEISQQWELLMDKYQQRIDGTPIDQKWAPMSCCFDLSLT